MAKLTEQVGTVNSGKPIIDPGREGPSVLGGVADLISGAIPGATKFVEERRAEGRAATLDAFAGDAHRLSVGATQEAARSALVAQPYSPEAMGQKAGLASEVSSAVPAEVKAGVAEMVRMQRGVEQGRVSRAGYDLQLEALVTDYHQKFPEMRAEISEYARVSGLEHYMYRGRDADLAAYKNEQEAQLAAERYQFDYAARAGAITSDTPIEVGAALGRQMIASATEAERLKEQAAQNRLALQDDREALAAADKRTAADMQGNLMGQLVTAFEPILQMNMGVIRGAGDDVERQSQIAGFKTDSLALLAQFESRGVQEILAAGGTPDDVTAFRGTIDMYRESINSVYTASLETNIASLRNIEASLRIDVIRAAPIYSRTVAQLGQGAANKIWSDANIAQLAPEVVAQLQREMTNYDPSTPSGDMSYARMIQYLRGETGLRDLNNEQATEFLRVSNTALVGAQSAVVGGDTSQLINWRPLYGNAVEAAVELLPTDGIQPFHTATGLIASPSARRALEVFRKEDPEYAAALTQASRAGSAHMLTANLGRRPEMTGAYALGINPQTGLYQVTVDPRLYEQGRRNFEAGQQRQLPVERGLGVDRPTFYPSAESMMANIPREYRLWTDVVNTNITHLVETDQFDEAIDNTMTRAQRRAAYANGSGPARKETAGGTADDAFNTMVGNLDTAITAASQSLLSTPGPDMSGRNADRNLYDTVLGHGRYGEPPKPITDMTIGEAITFGRETLIPATRGREELGLGGTDLGSSAVGAYQFTQGTLADFGPRVLGENWRNEPMSGENQEKLAEAIFNDSKGSAAALAGRWASLTLAEAERVRRMPWSEARQIIVEGEAGGRFQGQP